MLAFGVKSGAAKQAGSGVFVVERGDHFESFVPANFLQLAPATPWGLIRPAQETGE
jgi:hypothetical protein